jgi:acetate kinase
MNIFVINSGSSSIKYQLIRMPDAELVCSGLIERIGLDNSSITHKVIKNDVEKILKENIEIDDHAGGLQEVARLLTDKEYGVISNPDEIKIVGHRVLHGGDIFSATTIITEAVKDQIKKLFPLGPLHMPPNYTGIIVAEKIFTKATQVAVFDTAFHQTMPAKAFRYAIPKELYTTHHIRAYGFHGTSHKYVSEKALEYLKNPDAKIITIHLGNGSSIAAVDKGKCIDTTMGLGPLTGLIMGTRCGDIDGTVIFHMVNQLGYDINQVDTILNKKSGMLGLAGSSDMRDIKAEIEKGNEDAKLAYDMYAYRIRKYVGSYAAALGGLDAIVFTGGIGENDETMRKLSLSGLQFLGIALDDAKNNERQKGIREVNTDGSKVKVLIVPTNEELEIARQCYSLLKK